MFGVLLIHSFGSTNLEFREFAEYLQEQGFRTSTPLLPGHGTFPEDLGNYTYKDWLQASEKALRSLNCQVNFLVGQITGAPLALLLAAAHPELLGIVTLSGIINLPKWHTIFSTFLKYKSRIVSWGSPNSKVIPYNNPEIGKKVKLYEKVPHKGLRETFNLIQQSQKFLYKVNQPIYIFHSSAAQDISTKNAHFIFEGVSSKKKKLMFVDKGSPLMSVDVARHIVFRESTNFFWSCIDLYQM